MKIENLERVKELKMIREQLTTVIDKLETEEVTLSDEDGLAFETLPDFATEKLAALCKGMRETIEKEIETL